MPIFSLIIRPPLKSTLFPYTTLFRSFEDSRSILGVDARSLIDDVENRMVAFARSEEHTSELQSRVDLVCRLLLEKKNNNKKNIDCNLVNHNKVDDRHNLSGKHSTHR